MRTMSLLLIGIAFTLALLGCTSGTPNQDKERLFDVNGKVVSIDADKNKIRLNHEDIPGLMKAMEMDFAVSDSKILSGIKAGDSVHAKLKVKDSNYVITELHKR